MYLIERLIGVFTYASLLLITYLFIYFSKTKYIGKILFLYNIILSVMAFFFVPNTGSDLYRLVPIMHSYSQSTQILSVAFESNTPVAIIYMHVIGKLNIDGMLPAITAFIFFNNVFYILKRSVLEYNATAKDSALALLFFMSAGIFMEVISGIRTMLAFSIIAVCFYKEIIENKSIIKNLLWYVIAALIHTAAMALVIIRLLFLLVQRGKKIGKNMLYILLIIILGGVLLTYGSKYLVSMFEKGYAYYTKGTYSYIWQYVIGGIGLVTIMLTQVNARICIKKDNNDTSVNDIFKFTCLISLVVIAFSGEYNTFHRFIIFNSIISIPMLIYVLQNANFSPRKKSYFKLVIYALSYTMLLMACVRGNLSSLKFFIW